MLYLLTGDVEPEERCAIQKKYDTPEDYTYELTGEERLESCRELVAQSRLMREQCEALGLPFYETARERERVFAAAVREIRAQRSLFQS